MRSRDPCGAGLEGWRGEFGGNYLLDFCDVQVEGGVEPLEELVAAHEVGSVAHAGVLE